MDDVIKVKPWGKDQGEYVLIDKADFDPEKHELFDGDQKRVRKPRE